MTCKAEFWTQCGCLWMLYANEFGGARSCDQNFTGQKWAESGQFWTNISRYLLILMKNGSWFLSALSTAFLLVMFVYSNLNTIFFLFSYFFFFFILLLQLSTFKPLNALYSKFEWLKISGRTSTGLKLGMPGWGIPLKLVLQNFEL